MSYIAIDLWNKRVWLAVSQEGIAFPLSIIARTELIKYLKRYLLEHLEVSHFIVGLPYDLYGQDTRQLDKTIDFMKKLETIFPKIHIIGHDERFSSFQADEGFIDHRDDIAAQCILQSYIDSNS